MTLPLMFVRMAVVLLACAALSGCANLTSRHTPLVLGPIMGTIALPSAALESNGSMMIRAFDALRMDEAEQPDAEYEMSGAAERELGALFAESADRLSRVVADNLDLIRALWLDSAQAQRVEIQFRQLTHGVGISDGTVSIGSRTARALFEVAAEHSHHAEVNRNLADRLDADLPMAERRRAIEHLRSVRARVASALGVSGTAESEDSQRARAFRRLLTSALTFGLSARGRFEAAREVNRRFAEAVEFVVLHELAHSVLRHESARGATDPAQLCRVVRQQELDADSFAIAMGTLAKNRDRRAQAGSLMVGLLELLVAYGTLGAYVAEDDLIEEHRGHVYFLGRGYGRAGLREDECYPRLEQRRSRAAALSRQWLNVVREEKSAVRLERHRSDLMRRLTSSHAADEFGAQGVAALKTLMARPRPVSEAP